MYPIMRKKEREISRQEAMDILRESPYCTFSVTLPDGTPYCVPVSLAFEGDTAYMHCSLQGAKTEALRGDGRVTLCGVALAKPLPERFTMAYRSAIAFGTAEMVEDAQEKLHAMDLICQRWAASNMDDFQRVVPPALPRTGICKITLLHVTGKAMVPAAETP